MGIFNSLVVGVTGVQSQSSKISVISDNIANVNTVGYKQAEASFANIVAYDNNSGIYSPGGVRPGSRLLVSTAGLLRPTSNATDLGIDGNGMFVVRQNANGGELLYTRAGAFSKDQFGNLRNSSGFYLQGWRLDEQGNLPDALDTNNIGTGTANSLMQNINIANLTARPEPTSTVSLKANLPASQTAFDFTHPNVYDPADDTANMASGSVTPHYTTPFNVVDDSGTVHQFEMGYLKTGINTWAMEIYAKEPTDINATGIQVGGQIAAGTLTFNGDGSLSTVSPELLGPINVDWTNAANNNTITFDLGTAGPILGTPGATVIGGFDGIYQLDDRYTLDFINQNGKVAGSLRDISVDAEGYVSANFEGGIVLRVYKIPLANFRDPSQLTAISGNVYAQNTTTGDASYLSIAQVNIGSLVSNTLEESNVDLGRQLTDMIIAQRAYQANTKVLVTTDDMLQRLDEMVR